MLIIDIFNIIISYIYIIIWKKIIKKIIFLLTRTDEIERILNQDIRNFKTFENLSK